MRVCRAAWTWSRFPLSTLWKHGQKSCLLRPGASCLVLASLASPVGAGCRGTSLEALPARNEEVVVGHQGLPAACPRGGPEGHLVGTHGCPAPPSCSALGGPGAGGCRGLLTQGRVGTRSCRRSSGRAERLLLGRRMEEEDYDKQHYQPARSHFLSFFFSPAQIMQNTSTDLVSVFPKKTFRL